MKIHESWLIFQRGQRRDALRLLDEAEAELQPTGHTLSLGNIESARGRFVRRSGEYAKALTHFERAVTIYSERFPTHPNTARALVNAAYVKRLIALNLKHRSNTGRAKAAHHAQYLTICQDALDLLQKAGEIYSYHHHQAGTGAVYVNAGYLHLDSGDIDRAEDEASKAFTLGEHKQDHILMARARTLQSVLQNERAEEEAGESPDIALHAILAKTYSEEAVAIAKMTQATGIDEMLRSWSDGIVINKTFQQVTEEFAEIVIPKVWLREGRKISRVAELLSMSPKKVRRLLSKGDFQQFKQ